MTKISYKNIVKAAYAEAYCQELNLNEYVIYNHCRINEGGFVVIGAARTSALAWKDASSKIAK